MSHSATTNGHASNGAAASAAPPPEEIRAPPLPRTGQTRTDVTKLPEVDYLVLGGGTAGCIAANRLLKGLKGKATVLVVEAGDTWVGNQDAIVPALSVALRNGSANWNDPSLPQKALKGRSVSYDRGKILGGSSLLNFQVWTRGPAADYDLAAEATGDRGWAWENVLPIYKQLERFHPEVPAGMERYANVDLSTHGEPGEGEVPVGFNNCWGTGVTNFLDACEERGHPRALDGNAAVSLGAGLCQWSVHDGVRSSSAQSFLHPDHCDWTRLTIATGVLIDRVVFDDDKRAVGAVVVGADGAVATVQCRREVILTCGSIGTTAVLQRSGIGSSQLLSSLGIPVVVDRPRVGQEFVDHPRYPVIYRLKEGLSSHDVLRTSPERRKEAMEQYEREKKGLLSSIASGPILWHRFPDLSTWKEYELLSASEKEQLSHPGRPHAEILSVSAYSDRTSVVPKEGNHVTVVAFQHNAASRGRINITTRDPKQSPELELGMYEHPFDRRVAMETIREMISLLSTKAYEPLIDALVVAPDGAEVGRDGRGLTDEQLWRHLEVHADRGYHCTGTAYMGKEGDEEAVTDTRFRVRGTKGLRVGDLSIWPTCINAHTQALAYLIGHRAAQAILEDESV